jgi:hypothetical protein
LHFALPLEQTDSDVPESCTTKNEQTEKKKKKKRKKKKKKKKKKKRAKKNTCESPSRTLQERAARQQSLQI